MATPPSRDLASVAPTTRRQKTIERSCILCHRRKVRCDKKSPCSTCTRTGVLCCYPSGEKALPRSQKTTIATIASRLVQLERTIVAISSNTESSQVSTSANADLQRMREVLQPGFGDEQMGIPDEARAAGAPPTDEILVQNGHSSQYINDFLLSRVIEEEQEIQTSMATPSFPSENNSQAGTPAATFNFLGMLSGNIPPITMADTQDLHPSKGQATQLWQIFLQNVDPICKILHIPMAQVTVFTAINHPDKATSDINCLLFAIYFAAITSLPPDDVVNLLGHDKTSLLSRFKFGLESSLAYAKILEQPTLMGLQALGLFLHSMRAHSPGRTVWIVNGMAIRAAQSIGLHRDGSNFPGMTPFDAEMRRRVWWNISSSDSRAAEDHGIAVSSLEPSADIQLPRNIDDSVLEAGMNELPPNGQAKWTQMTLPIAMYEIYRATRKYYWILAGAFGDLTGPRPAAVADIEAQRKILMDKLTARIDELLAPCNPVIPVQRATLVIPRLVLRKQDFISQLQIANRDTDSDKRVADATEERLVDACEILELSQQLYTDELLRNFHWARELYPQYHILLYLLWHLRVRPTGPNVERAWRAVDREFQQEDFRRRREDVGDPGSQWKVLHALRQKALHIRDTGLTSVQNPVDSVSGFELEHENGAFESFTGDKMLWDNGLLVWDSLADQLSASYDLGGTR